MIQRLCVLPFLMLLVAPALAREPADQAPPIPPRVVGLIESLQEATQDGDRAAIAHHFDARALAAELTASGALDGLPTKNGMTQDALADRLVGGLLQGPNLMQPFMAFRLSGYRPAEDGDRALLDLRTRDDRGIWTRFRFWLTERGGQVRIADVETVALGLRLSQMFALGVKLLPQKQKPAGAKMDAALRNLQSGLAELAAGNTMGARMQLEAIEAGLLPPGLEAPRLIGLAAAAIDSDDAYRALGLLSGARRLGREAPILDYLEALALGDLGRYEEALPIAQRYIAAIGADVDGYVEVARASWHLGRTGQAIEAATAATKDDPRSGEALAWLGITLPSERLAEATLRLGRIEPREEQFDLLSNTLVGEGAHGALERFARAWSVVEPKSPDGPFRLGQALGALGQKAKAEAAYTQALGLATDPELFSYYQEPLLLLLLEQGEVAKAYAAARDKVEGAWFLGLEAFAQADAHGTLLALAAQVPGDAPGMLGRIRGLLLVRAHYLKRDWGEMAKILPALVDGATARVEQHEAANDSVPENLYALLYEGEALLIRTLIHTKQLAEAEKRAKRLHERDEDPLVLAYVRLAKGEYTEALELLEWALSEEWLSAQEMLEDEDIKGHLSHDTLKAFHAKLLAAVKAEDR